jgi:hypothetical protein
LAVAYLVLFVLVWDAERGAPEDTFGAYLFLFVAYAVGAVALLLRPRRTTFVVGAAVQGAVLVLFVVFGLGLLGPGVFSYDAVSHLHMPVWATFITTAQLVLLLSLVLLSTSSKDRRVGSGHRR